LFSTLTTEFSEMPRLQNISKYCVVWRSAAPASSNEYAMLTPSSGFCWTPCTKVGSGRRAASRTVGATSITCANCERISPRARIPLGQWTIVPLRVPPRCDATCFVHWYGVHIACAQPTA
jgi:hypothetical protein